MIQQYWIRKLDEKKYERSKQIQSLCLFGGYLFVRTIKKNIKLLLKVFNLKEIIQINAYAFSRHILVRWSLFAVRSNSYNYHYYY